MSEELDETLSGRPRPGPSQEPGAHGNPGPEPVWTYRGYQLRASEFTTAMVHLFRAEVQRANMWRQRLDATTNWAVITTGAAITIAFSRGATEQSVIILNTILVTLFLYIEARRYRYYELWSYRVRLMETDFFATMLVPPFHPASDWAESLADNLLHPQFPISMLEALGRRYRRNYMWIYFVLAIAWAFIGVVYPTPVGSWAELIARARVGFVPGEVVLAVGLLFNGLLLLFGLLTVGLQHASGEVLPRFGIFTLPGAGAEAQPGQKRLAGLRAWFRPSRRRQQLLAFIITGSVETSQTVAEHILHDMRRGVTGLPGTGMYTGQPHNVLMCALTATEVPQLKAVVSAQDPNAFVIVSPAQEVLGQGFFPLQQEV
jgi:uncharacterized membrane protein